MRVDLPELTSLSVNGVDLGKPDDRGQWHAPGPVNPDDILEITVGLSTVIPGWVSIAGQNSDFEAGDEEVTVAYTVHPWRRSTGLTVHLGLRRAGTIVLTPGDLWPPDLRVGLLPHAEVGEIVQFSVSVREIDGSRVEPTVSQIPAADLPELIFEQEPTTYGQLVSVVFPEPGKYRIKITATASNGVISEQVLTVTAET